MQVEEQKSDSAAEEQKTDPTRARVEAEKTESNYASQDSNVIDSDNGSVKSITAALKIPVEDKSTSGASSEKPEDVLDSAGGGDEDEEGDGLGIDEELFGDHQLMADIGVEVIDLAFTFGAMAIAGENNEEQFTVSAQRRNRIKKPLALLLKNRDVSVSPEIMVIVIIMTVYAPVMMKAIKMRAEKAKKKKKSPEDVKRENMERIMNDAKQHRHQNSTEQVFTAPPMTAVPEDKKEKAPVTRSDRSKLQIEALALKKQGKTNAEVGVELGVSESTVIRWVKAADKQIKRK